MRKESPLMTIWDGGKLVGLHIHCPTATCPQPDRLEEELVRIFNEKMELEAKSKKLKERYKDQEQLWKLVAHDKCNGDCDLEPTYKQCPECLAKHGLNFLGEIVSEALWEIKCTKE